MCANYICTAVSQSSENSGDASVTAGETETDVLYHPAGPDDQPVNTRRTCLSLSTESRTKKLDTISLKIILDQANNAKIVKN